VTNRPARVWLLAVALGSAAHAADPNGASPAGQRESRPQPSITIEAQEAVETAPPYPEVAEKPSIRDYILDNSGPIRECYEKRLGERPTLQGKLIARFDIGPTGKVIGATADGIADKELVLCVVTAVRRFEFEKPQSGGKIRIAYPFKFEPRPAK
jgi:outer membrane biosynthesis protein TonB